MLGKLKFHKPENRPFICRMAGKSKTRQENAKGSVSQPKNQRPLLILPLVLPSCVVLAVSTWYIHRQLSRFRKGLRALARAKPIASCVGVGDGHGAYRSTTVLRDWR